MDLIRGPIREGNRGGLGLFKWEDVEKETQFRENYLGNSVKAPQGRWAKGKDLDWYTKDRKSEKDEAQRAAELKRLKQAEEEAMNAVLGIAKVAPTEERIRAPATEDRRRLNHRRPRSRSHSPSSRKHTHSRRDHDREKHRHDSVRHGSGRYSHRSRRHVEREEGRYA